MYIYIYIYPGERQKIIENYRKKKWQKIIWDLYNSIIMEYQKIIKLLGNTPNQPSKFRIKYWVEMNDGGSRTYNPNSQIKFKTSMLKSSLCRYIDSYVLRRIISRTPAPSPALNPNNSNKELIFKNCVPFTDCISEISNTQIDNAKDNDVVMPMCNLIEYSDNY